MSVHPTHNMWDVWKNGANCCALEGGEAFSKKKCLIKPLDLSVKKWYNRYRNR